MAGPARVRIDIIGDARTAVKAANETETAYRGLGSTMGGMARTAATFLGGAAIVAGVRRAVNAASDLNESMNKSNAVFGANARAIEAWSRSSAQSFGQSQQQALENAASFGNMFRQMDIGVNTATKMSKSMVELAADFASFHNADITDVLQAQQAAFRGEYDAVQRFVPTINAAAVETKALAMTGKENASQLTAQEKAMATYTLMTEGAGKALGDFDKTSGSFANQQRILNAQLQNLAASLGQLLLPAFSQVTSVLSVLIDGLLALPRPIQGVVIALGIGGAVWALWGDAIANAVRALPRLTTALTTAGLEVAAFMERMTLATGLSFGWMAAIAAVATAMIGLAVWVASGKRETELATEAGRAWAKVQGENARAIRDQATALDTLLGKQRLVTVQLDDARTAYAGYQTALQGGTDGLDLWGASTVEATRRANSLSVEIANLEGKHSGLAVEIANMKREHELAARAEAARQREIAALATGTASLATATDDARRALTEYQNQVLAVQGGQIGLESALLNVEVAQKRLTDTMAEHGAGSIEARQAANDLRAAELGVSSAVLKQNDDQLALNATLAKGADGLVVMRDVLQREKDAHGDATGAIQRQIDTINGLIDKTKQVPVFWDTVFVARTGDAEADVRRFNEMADYAARTRNVHFDLTWSGIGPNVAGFPSVSFGPTMRTLSAAPQVMRTAGAPAGPSMMAAAGPPVINVTVQTTGLGADAPEIQRAVIRAIRGYVDRNGPLERITPP